MNKDELSFAIANRIGMTQTNVEEVINAFSQIVTERLADGEKVQLFGFGTFDVKQRDQRMARNPKTGVSQLVDSRRVPFFKPGKNLKEAVKNIEG